MTTVMSVRQALELGRIADRCGPVAVTSLEGGHVAIAFATVHPPTPTFAIALSRDGRVVGHRRLRRSS